MRWCFSFFLVVGVGGFLGCAGDDGDDGVDRGDGDDGTSGDNPRGGGGSQVSSQSSAYRAACETFCNARQQAACGAIEPLADCVSACAEDGDLEPNCANEFTALVGCANGAPMVCNGQAPRVDVDCSSQSAAYDQCMAANDWISTSIEPCTVYSCQGLCHIAFGCVECLENTDCGPTEECTVPDGVCRQRCLSDSDCPGAFCSFSQVCGDPVGTPCSGFSDCEGGSCIDVDANLTTVEPYCTVTCIEQSCIPGYPCEQEPVCPEGYTCQQRECRRL